MALSNYTTVSLASDKYQISKSTITKACQNKDILAVKMAGVWFIDKVDLAYWAENTHTSKPGPKVKHAETLR